ncbi:MAG: chemotaxis protein CheW [bacterium]
MSVIKTQGGVVEDDLYDEDNEDTQKDKFLTFQVGNEDYGIEIQYVTEIIGIQKITEVPDMPDFVKGVINLRGKVIPVMDVRTRFKIKSRDYDDRTCIVVVNINETSIGFVVDTVREVVDIPESQIEPPPKTHRGGSGSRYIKGMGKIGDEVKILLDVTKLLFEEELEQIGTRADVKREIDNQNNSGGMETVSSALSPA